MTVSMSSKSEVLAGGRPEGTISLLLSDIDGTLVTKDKRLTNAAIDAVRSLRDAGIAFAIVSSRPPRGLTPFIEALSLTTPVSGFNSGMIIGNDGAELRRRSIEPQAAREAVAFLDERGVDAWLFSGNDWLIRNAAGARVPFEQKTIGYDPILVEDFGEAYQTATKIVGTTDDAALLARCETELRGLLGGTAAVALSQSYYLDITHPDANKGEAVLMLAKLLNIPVSAIATIGDMSNDVSMFERSGFSIAMGNATDAVKQQANVTTKSNQDEGFAEAVARYILPPPRSPRDGER